MTDSKNKRIWLYILLFAFIVTLLSCSESIDKVYMANDTTSTKSTLRTLEYDSTEDGPCQLLNYETDGNGHWGYKTTAVNFSLKKKNTKKIIYYFEENVFSNLEKYYKNLSPAKEILPNAVNQMLEVWMSESIAPPIEYGGIISSSKFKVLNASEEVPVVLIRFQEGCATESTEDTTCIPNAMASALPLVETIPGSKKTEKDKYKIVIDLYEKLYTTIHLDANGTQTKDTSKGETYVSIDKAPLVVTVDENVKFMRKFVHESDISNTTPSHKTYIKPIFSTTLKGVLMHEFGHVLGLGHYTGDAGRSVMNSSINSFRTSHLWHWDKKCIRALYGNRNLKYHGRTVNSLGNFTNFGDDQLNLYSNSFTGQNPPQSGTNKASRLGINLTIPKSKDKRETFSLLSVETPGMPTVYEIPRTCTNKKCLDSRTTKTTTFSAKNEYSLDWSPFHNGDRLLYFNINPTFSQMTNESSRAETFIHHYSGEMDLVPKNEDAFDPPKIMVSYKENKKLLDFHAFGTHYQPGSSILGTLYSHLPVAVAYDHKTRHYIYAYVDTFRTVTGDVTEWPNSEGGISLALYNEADEDKGGVEYWELHDMLHTAGKNRVRDRIEKHKYWGIKYKTDFGVAVACTDHFTKTKYDNFNCYLAWVDRGMPKRRNVAYVWFRIVKKNGNYEIDWSNKIYIRDNFYSVGHLSAAYVGGSLVLVGKKGATEEVRKNGQLHMTVNPLNKATGFHPHNPSYDFGKNVVDAPSVGAARYREKDSNTTPIDVQDGYVTWTEY